MASIQARRDELIAKYKEEVNHLTDKLNQDLTMLEETTSTISDTGSFDENTFWAIRPCESSWSDYRRFIQTNFKNGIPSVGDVFTQSWGYRSSLKNGLASEKSLAEVYSTANPLGELVNLYTRQAADLINKIYNIHAGMVFYSVQKNHRWECQSTGPYQYDDTKAFPHFFEARIVRILDLEDTRFRLKNIRPTITKITFD